MGITQPINKNRHNQFTNLFGAVADSVTQEAAKRLIQQAYPDEENFDEKIANIKVSVDGTWQKRGHCSKLGVVFVIFVETGEALDFEVKNLYCHQCAINKNTLSKDDFKNWYNVHKSKCNVNHEGFSGAMEAEATVDMFLRYVSKNSLRYTTYVGDGDSSSFATVHAKCLEKFGEEYNVKKEECLGHVQKRMGKALLELVRTLRGQKLADGKSVGGKDRLTKRAIDRIQNNYGSAIRSSVGDAQVMYNAIWAVFKHTIDPKLSLEEQHDLCPRKGWCRFWLNKDTYKQTHRLPPVYIELLKPIFCKTF